MILYPISLPDNSEPVFDHADSAEESDVDNFSDANDSTIF